MCCVTMRQSAGFCKAQHSYRAAVARGGLDCNGYRQEEECVLDMEGVNLMGVSEEA
jgi:hypothetical protein